MLTPEQLDIRNRWMEALRSGRYKKTTGMLRSGEKYCCLGVLCDIVDPDGWVQTSFRWYEHRNYISAPAKQIQESIKLRVSNFFSDFADVDGLVNLNDMYKLSFEEIAEAIHFITLADMEDAD